YRVCQGWTLAATQQVHFDQMCFRTQQLAPFAEVVMIRLVAGTLIDGREYLKGCDKSQGARLADFDGVETQRQFHLHQTLNRCGGDESDSPHVATGRLRLPDTYIGTHVASLGNLDDIVCDAWGQAGNITRLQDAIEPRPHFVR